MIHYLEGNAVEPVQTGNKIIAHVCNDISAWGKGFVLAISKKWKEPEKQYRSLERDLMNLGYTQFVRVEDDIVIANMIAQRGIFRDDNNLAPIRYIAVEHCLKAVAERARATNACIVLPRIGTGLAGGKWSIMEKVIESAVGDVDVYVYDFVNTKDKNYVKPNLD